MELMAEFIYGEQGQDLVEYTLLIAFVIMASAAMYVNAGGSITGIWTTANSHLVAGAASAIN